MNKRSKIGRPWDLLTTEELTVEYVPTSHVIEPWMEKEEKRDLDPNLPEEVPPYLEEIAHEVLRQYDYKAKNLTVMATKPHKGGAIWRVDTDKGPIGLKALHRKKERSLFSIGAQHHLVDQGARVPEIILTKKGSDCVDAGEKIWFVMEWNESLTEIERTLEGTKIIAAALGEFHMNSRNYAPPKGAQIPSRLFKWPKKYQKMITKLDWFRNLSKLYNETPASPVILSVLDQFQQDGRSALEKLEQSPYYDLCTRGEMHWGFVHQDYGWGNAQMGSDGVWIIDLDGVTYDLPIHDLRKFITSNTDKEGWDTDWILQVVEAYHSKNPMEKEMYEVLLIDLAFPHEFYDLIKLMVFDPVTFLNEELTTELQTVIQAESNKHEVIAELEKKWKEKGLC